MRRIPAIAALVLCVAALFWRLDGVPLWRDEATTAVWGRLMAASGDWLPYAFDRELGQLLVQDDDGHDINSHLLPAMQSYLQFYVSAAGHWLFGSGTLPARLPFALFGLGCLALLWSLGRQLGGPRWLPLALPVIASVSIYFVHAARQGRYYILVVFATLLLLAQVARYLRNPALGRKWSFHCQLCLVGCLLYAGNYLSFAATWLALGLFLLLTDRPTLARLCGASAVLAVVLGAEFWLLHAEYLTEWRPGSENAFWENFRYVVSRRGADYWRWVPFVVLAPAMALLGRWSKLDIPRAGWVLAAAGAAAPLLGFVIGEPWLRRTPDWTFVLFGLVFLCLPTAGIYLWSRIEKPGIHAKMALLAGLIVVVCPLFTIAVAGRATLPRYYYQACPAAIVLVGLGVAGLDRVGRRRTALACLVGASLWPNLELAGGGTEQVVLRQFLRYDDHNGPLLEFLESNTKPGQTIAYVRNVKGMVGNYYLPDRRWVNLLDSEIAYNQRFRDLLPADQFDDSPDPDWVVIWDAKGKHPKALDSRYDLVWEHSYRELRSYWNLDREPRERGYAIHRLNRGASSARGDAESGLQP